MFKASVVKAVMFLFPEISFVEEQFAVAPSNISSFNNICSLSSLGYHWFSIQNRRDFFEDFAKDHNFDALVADNWYSHNADSLRSFKVINIKIKM